MAGNCVQKLPHEKCGSRNGLQVFEEDGKYTGYCFKCDTYVPHPYGEGVQPDVKAVTAKTPEQIQEELDEISRLRAADVDVRALKKETLEYFGVKVGLSEQDGETPTSMYYPYTKDGKVVGYKARLLEPKQFWAVGSTRSADFFGWQQALTCNSNRTLFITEGENDALALWQALKSSNKGGQWEHLDPAVISLHNGAGSAAREIGTHLAAILRRFKDVVLVFDNDDAGKAGTDAALKIIPGARTAEYQGKDPNEALINGRAKALVKAVLWDSKTPKNTRLVNASSLYAVARQQAEWGLSWPWQGLTDLTRGIRFGETYYLGAGVKMGKSELVNSIASHLMITHDMPVFLAKPEEANRKTVQMVLGKVAGKIFHDPTVEFDYEAYDQAAKLVGDKLEMLSLYQHMGWETLKHDIIAAVQRGCRAVFIDPITNLVNGTSAGETNTVLQEIAQELAALAMDLNIVIFIFCHLKAPLTGDSHERGGKVISSQFSGSRAMMRSCNLMLGLEGNKDPDLDEEIRNMRKLVILEDREFGASGYIDLYWDKNTSLFNEIKRA